MAEQTATFAVALTQYREARDAQDNYEACVYDPAAAKPHRDATAALMDAVISGFDALVAETWNATGRVMRAKAQTMNELAAKLDVMAEQDFFEGTEVQNDYLSAIQADARALAEKEIAS